MTITLYRPVGQAEYALIEASGFSAFPPRLPEQPIFYPVCNEEYAREITEQWNAPCHGGGYVTRFAVKSEFLAHYKTEIVGARRHEEYWIPSEVLAGFNAAIVGKIEVIAYYPPPSLD